MLLDECHQVGVEILTGCDVGRLDAHADGERKGQGYALEVNQSGQTQTYRCEALVVATGALSIPTLGGSDMGYEIARQFGLSLVERRAGLVPLMFSDAMKLLCEHLSGLALEVDISCNGYAFTENLLFTHRGISGPAVLQISNYWHPGDAVTVDLLPNVDATDWLLSAKSAQSKSYLKTLLGQSLAKSLVAELGKLFWLQWEDKTMADIPDAELGRIAQQLHALSLIHI